MKWKEQLQDEINFIDRKLGQMAYQMPTMQRNQTKEQVQEYWQMQGYLQGLLMAKQMVEQHETRRRTFDEHLQDEMNKLKEEERHENQRRQTGQARQLLLPLRDRDQIRHLIRAIRGDGAEGNLD